MLNERQNKEAELYAHGVNVTNIAKLCDCSRQTIYNDMERKEWKAKVDDLLTEAKQVANNKLNNDVELYVDELKKIALTSKSENNKKDALMYLLNRIYGTPTNKTQDITDKQEDNSVNQEELDKEFNKFKVINTEEKAN